MILNSDDDHIFQQPLSAADVNPTTRVLERNRCKPADERVSSVDEVPPMFQVNLALRGSTIPPGSALIEMGDGRNLSRHTVDSTGQLAPTLSYGLNPELPFTIGKVCKFGITFKLGQIW